MRQEWKVGFTSKAAKEAKRLARREQEKLQALIRDLSINGPIAQNWPNYSKLGKNLYHCHLSYKWVACWTVENEMLKFIEVYYVGSRENAPY